MSFTDKKKNKEPELHIDAADKLLNNIFKSCEREPNSTPLTILENNVRRHRRHFLLQKLVLVLALVLLIAVPVCYFKTSDRDTATVSVPADSKAGEQNAPTDHESPVITSDYREGDCIYFVVSDAGSGVDYANITAKDTSGANVTPLSYDESSSTVVFAYPETSLNIFIPDKAGNTLQAVLTVG